MLKHTFINIAETTMPKPLNTADASAEEREFESPQLHTEESHCEAETPDAAARESARKLAALGGSEKELAAVSRRRRSK